MGTENVIIRITERGTRRVSNSIRTIGTESKRAHDQGVRVLQRGLGALAAALSIRAIAQYADQVTNLRNRLSILNLSTAETAAATEDLFKIAVETRSEFDVTAQVYSRTALAARGLGFAQRELLDITRALNQAVVLSGTNAREAANGLIQLSQAIASNRLGGDELRSILEQLPLVTDIIGKELVRLGIAVRGTRGEVRALGFEGKITADIILNAVKNSIGELDAQFAKTTVTIAQATTVLGVRLAQAIAKFNEGTDAAAAFSSVILVVANNLGELARVGTVVAAVFAGRFIANIIAGSTALAGLGIASAAVSFSSLTTGLVVLRSALLVNATQALPAFILGLRGATLVSGTFAGAQVVAFNAAVRLRAAALAPLTTTMVGLRAATLGASRSLFALATRPLKLLLTGIRSITAAIAANPFGALLVTITALVGITVAFGDRIKVSADGLVNLQDVGGAALDGLKNLFLTLGDGASALFTIIGVDGPNAFVQLASVATGALRILASTVDLISAPFVALAGGELGGLRTSLELLIEQSRVRGEIRRQAAAIAEVERKAADEALKRKGERVPGIPTPQEIRRGEALAKINRDLAAEGLRLLDVNQRRAEIDEDLFRINEKLLSQGKGLTESETKRLRTALERNQALKEQADVLNDLLGPLQDFEARQKAINDVVARFPALAEQANRALVEARIALLSTQIDAASGFERGFLQIGQSIGDLATVAENSMVNAFNNAESALVEFVNIGKLSLGEFFTQLQNDITKLALRAAILKPLSEALGLDGGGGGGIAGGVGKFLGGFFGGGGANTGTPTGTIDTSDPFNFARGGQFRVGGASGTDRERVAFNATAGETVTVTPRSEEPPGRRSGGSVTINITTPDTEGFQRSQGQIMSRAATQLARAQQRNG